MKKADFEGSLKRLARVDRALVGMKRHAAAIAIVWIVIGVVLLALSALLGIHVFSFDGRLADGGRIDGFSAPKEIGYASALNVTIVSIVLLPALLFAVAQARSAMENLADKLVENGMVRNRKEPFELSDKAAFISAWRKHMGVSAAFGVIFTFLAAALMLHDYVDVVLRPLMSDEPIYEICPGLRFAEDYPCNLFNTSVDLDWSVAALFPNGPESKLAAGAFAGLVYLFVPTAGSALTFFAFVQFVFFGSFYARPSLESMGIAITPARQTDNPSFGFEYFTETFVAIAWCALLCIVSLYFAHIQNIYWRVPEASNIIVFYGLTELGQINSPSALWRFFTADLAEMWSLGAGDMLKTRQAIFAVVLVPFTFLTPLIFAYLVLFDTAAHGGKLIREKRAGDANAQSPGATSVIAPNAWPIIRLGLSCSWLLLLLILAISSFIWPRFIFIVSIFMCILAGQYGFRHLIKRSKAA